MNFRPDSGGGRYYPDVAIDHRLPSLGSGFDLNGWPEMRQPMPRTKPPIYLLLYNPKK